MQECKAAGFWIPVSCVCFEDAVSRALFQEVGFRERGVYGTVALLRLVAVDHARRSRGLGRLLVKAQLEGARKRGIQEVYLLTETAHDYCSCFSFRQLERPAVSPAIRRSVEWTRAGALAGQAMVLRVKEE